MQGRFKEIILMLVVSCAIASLAISYFANISPSLKEIESAYAEGTVINLDANFEPAK